MPLPSNIVERIEDDADKATAKFVEDFKIPHREGYYNRGYLDGATAEAERAQKLVGILSLILEQAEDPDNDNDPGISLWNIHNFCKQALAEWKGAGKYNTKYQGTVLSEPAPGIALCSISPEARELLDTIMEQWDKHYKKVKTETYQPTFYAFAYWLIRWSGLIQPAANDAGKEVEV